MIKHKHTAAIQSVQVTGHNHHWQSPDKTLMREEKLCDHCGQTVSVLMLIKGEMICVGCAIKVMEI